MLKLILGRAKSGKTGSIMEEMRQKCAKGEKGMVLLVPEQYSHEAERELLRVCGDSLSLHAEVLSFTRLSHRVLKECGLSAKKFLDGGGRALTLALALDAVGSRLKIYSSARRQTPMQESILSAIDELKSACVSPEALALCAQGRADALGDKLRDMELIYSAYEAICAQSALDPLDALSLLSENFHRSAFAGCSFYIDGFTDFTYQQQNIILSMLRSGCAVTVCLSCEGLSELHDIFEPSRRAALSLLRGSESAGVESKISLMKKNAPATAMEELESHLFTFDNPHLDSQGKITLRVAGGLTAECEAAAAHCLRLVRECGCRWRDIAIAIRGYETYRAALENIFARYGVPLFSARKSDIFEKPIPALIQSAFAIIGGGWSYEDMFTYLKTGLAGLSAEECDTLEGYVFLWSLRGSAWTREEPWRSHPDGYDGEFKDESFERLRAINSLRRRAAAPLALLQEKGKAAKTAAEHCAALAEFLDALHLPETLAAKAKMLREQGRETLAGEYMQLWEIVLSALEQCAAVLGDMELDFETFGKLFCLVLGKYSLGSIPLSADKVSAGDMDRMRRRSIKHLIVLGCDASRIPSTEAGAGIFSDEDRLELQQGGIDIGDSPTDRLYREFALAYNCLSLPSESLYISYCSADGEGGKTQPSFIISRIENIFGIETEAIDLPLCKIAAPAPAMELAVAGDGSALAAAAAEYFTGAGKGEELNRLRAAAKLSRGRLSKSSVRALYGEKLRLSASRIDKMASCPFSYFLQYGLKAKPRQAAEFAPPEMGTFMHYVLENVAREVNKLGGFAAVPKEILDSLCDEFVKRYIHEKLDDFREKSPRFEYLFRRLIKNVRSVVGDMAAELARSDFKPLDFELDFGSMTSFPPVELGEEGSKLMLTGIADRIDGWYHDGKLYVRVVDYKTGRKKFNLSDVWYGMGLQMLLYLFALSRNGESRYGAEIVPAGVMYVPARDVLVSADADISDEAILTEKLKGLRRSGLVLDEEAVLKAMEHGDEPVYIPVTIKKGEYTGDGLASAEQLGLLSRHIDATLRDMAKEMHSGCISADPYYRSSSENACRYCDYASACHFGGEEDGYRYLDKIKAADFWAKLQEGEEG
ncbi:MAG: PD-(D/E)XK nuclease family protein [Oscillospiraceae bacterium]|nr:PD-(D/E)XK nuclease family protein [Oscillospiraceae bacterium]